MLRQYNTFQNPYIWFDVITMDSADFGFTDRGESTPATLPTTALTGWGGYSSAHACNLRHRLYRRGPWFFLCFSYFLTLQSPVTT